jgi:integrase
MVKRICRQARIPEVCPHGLRGTHASIARERGATSHLIATAVGHESFGVTERHYLRPGLEGQVQQRQVMTVLAGGKR